MVDSRLRKPAPLKHSDPVEHRRQIATRANVGLPIDGTYPMQNPLLHRQYTVSTVPTASLWTGATIYVSDQSDGAVMAFSDGSSWRRFTDRAVVS